MVKLPKVTVITVTFNLIQNGRKDFFRQCVESVHNQTYKNIEHLIIDGASTDGTLDVIKEYADKGWVHYISEPDKGHVDAMNKGIKMASGEYVAILNSDDYYLPDMVKLSVDAILKNHADYSYSDCDMIKDEKKVSTWTCSELDIARFFIKYPFNHEAMLCKKEVCKELNYYDWEKDGTASDISFVNSLILGDYNRVYINKPLLQFRLGGCTNTPDPQGKKLSLDKHLLHCAQLYTDLWMEFMPKEMLAYYTEKFKKGLPSIKERERECNLDFALHLTKYLAEKKLRNYPYKELFSCIKNLTTSSSQIKYIETKVPEAKVLRVGLFDFIPFFKILTRKDKKIFYLFNFIPLFSIKNIVKGFLTRKIVNVFKYFPIIYIKQKSNLFYVRIFKVIPLFKIKKEI